MIGGGVRRDVVCQMKRDNEYIKTNIYIYIYIYIRLMYIYIHTFDIYIYIYIYIYGRTVVRGPFFIVV